MKRSLPYETNNEEIICISLNEYYDVFSDFDSRPFNTRVFSDDFLNEVKTIANELPKKSKIALKFQFLGKKRDEYSETVIINNLNTYFRRNTEILKDEKKETKRKGYFFTVLGFIVICLPVLLSIYGNITTINHISIIVEPVGWFLTWTGLDNVFQSLRKDKITLDFYAKMAEAKVSFCAFQPNDTKKDHSNTADTGISLRKEMNLVPVNSELNIAI